MDNEEKDVEERQLIEEGKEFSPRFFETTSVMGKVQKGIHWVSSFLMTLLTVIIIAAVLVSFNRIPGLFKALIHGEEEALRGLLSYVAKIIIAIELVYVIIAQNLDSVIEIIMIAFTRELIINEWGVMEMLLGVCVIAGLFAVKKFLIDRRK